MPTAALVVTAPALSVERAVSTWLPVGTFLHVKEYGALVSWPSTLVPSRNSTLATLPSGSLAVAVTVIVGFQAKIAPSAGEVMFDGRRRVGADRDPGHRARGGGAEVVGGARGERVGPGCARRSR